jgi:hypothetical protein
MDTFPKYQNVFKTNLMTALKTDYDTADAASNAANKVAAYTNWARKIDASATACRLYEGSFDWTASTGLGTFNARGQSNSKPNAHWLWYFTDKI